MNSTKQTARIAGVLYPSEYLSIFKVMFDLSGDSHLQQRQSHCQCYLIDLFVFTSSSQAVISAFAENSAPKPPVFKTANIVLTSRLTERS